MPSIQPPTEGAIDKTQRLQRLGVLFLFLAGAALMFVCARGDLFIDEVVSLNWAHNAPAWSALFTENQTDNNHLLNTLYMRLLGYQPDFFLYRIPAAVFGAAFLATLIFTARRLGKSVPVWVAVLAGLSYPVILYSSEARGYSGAMFFAALAYELIQQCWERFTLPKLVLFWTVLMLGLLSHFSFIMTCMALGIWSLWHDHAAKCPSKVVITNALKYFGIPAVFVAGLYLIYIRKMSILGGNIQPKWEAIGDAVSYLLGLNADGWLRWLAMALATTFVTCGVIKMFREKRGDSVFFLAAIVIAPAIMLILWNPKFLYFRYFAITFPFFYLLMGYVLARWFSSAGKGKWIPVILVIGITAGHLVKTVNLIRYGRGNYSQAVFDMAAATPGPVIKVASDHDFRNGTLLQFYARFLPRTKTLEYILKEQRHQIRPDWVVMHCLDATFPPYLDIDVTGWGKYELFGNYPFCGSSGWAWSVYHGPVETNANKTISAPH